MQRGILELVRQTGRLRNTTMPDQRSCRPCTRADKRIAGPTSTWSARESERNLTEREGKDATETVDDGRKALFTLPHREKL